MKTYKGGILSLILSKMKNFAKKCKAKRIFFPQIGLHETCYLKQTLTDLKFVYSVEVTKFEEKPPNPCNLVT